MVQFVQVDVIHGATECPADNAESLESLIANLKTLDDDVFSLSEGKVNIKESWYDRNKHTFHYLLELKDIRIAEAEDILKKALQLPPVSVVSHPTESGQQALQVLEGKLKQLKAA